MININYVIRLVGIFFLLCGSSFCQVPYLVKDINEGPEDTGGMWDGIHCIDGLAFFKSYSSTYGGELWCTDGSTEGTYMVKDIFPGTQSGLDVSNEFIPLDSGVLFFANDGVHGFELWFSDGTEEETYMVKDIYEGSLSSCGISPQAFRFNGYCFFIADHADYGRELWRTDGTEEGTDIVKNINWSYLSAFEPSDHPDFTIMGDAFYFSATTSDDGCELWKSDGTEEGTELLKIIHYSPYHDGLSPSGPKYFFAFNDELYFEANDGENGNELWKTDGTEEGTFMVKDINPAYEGDSYAGAFHRKDDIFYFVATNPAYGRELWKSDGTEEGTVLVKDINPGENSSFAFGGPFANLGEHTYFAAETDEYGRELWKTDGTEEGTVMIKDIYPGWEDGAETRIYILNDELIFAARTETGIDIWKSNGTEDGTQMIKDISEIDGFGIHYQLIGIWAEDKIYFQADDGYAGNELWQTDGTEEGTYLTIDANPGEFSSNPNFFRATCGHIFFYADTEAEGFELWAIESGPIVGITEDNSINSNITTYPNPFSDHVTFSVQSDLDTEYMLKIFDLTGRLIFSSSLVNNLTITDLEINSGTYIYHILSDDGSQSSGRIVKE